MKSRLVGLLLVVVSGAILAAVAVARDPAGPDIFTVHALVSDDGTAAPAAATDKSLVNGWGLSAGPTTPWWTSNNGSNTSTLYSGVGTKAALTVSVPGGPTGTVYNGNAADFVVSQNGKSGSARFLFATEAGTILGWSPSVNGTTAVAGADASSSGAIYKGLAVTNDRLYATDFHNGRVDVFDGHFRPVETPGAFVDRDIPAGYAPFGIQAIGGSIFVTYAQQDADRHDDVPGPGHGFVDMYDTSGKLLQRVATRGTLDSPWGLAWAPSGFGPFAGDLLVGDFGDGRINAFQQHDGTFSFAGQLQSNGEPITIDGLWSLQFGHGEPANGSTGTLFFTAGPDHESHGLFGTITAG